MEQSRKLELSRKQRQENMTDILETLNPDKHNFNTMLLGFTDIMQTTFFAHLMAQCKSENEKKQVRDRINQTVNKVMEVLNENAQTNPEDMVVLNTVMIESIYKALVRQNRSDQYPVKTSMK